MGDVNGSDATGKERIEEKLLTPMQELDNALKECKFGRFHLRLLASGLMGTVANVLVSNTGYLLPNAECDLKMNLVQKGLLNAIPYIGMLFSSILAGFLTDTFGRKKFVLAGYGGLFLFTLIAGSSQSYEILVTAKLFEGILFATSFNAMITSTSEFCHGGIRDRVLLCQLSFNGLAQIVIAGFSWAILTQDWYLSFNDGYFVLNTWNFYLYLCSLWSLSAFCLYTLLPESPKYLVSQGKYDEARDILIGIYKENSRKSAHTFSGMSLWRDQKYQENAANLPKTTFLGQILGGLRNSKPMFRRPLSVYLITICFMASLSMLMMNVIRLWFPQLSTIIEYYGSLSNTTQDFCTMMDSYTSSLKDVADAANEVCVPHKSGDETYINSLILGTVCVCPYLILGILVNRVGKKLLLISAAIITVICTISLRFSSTKAAVVSMFSIDVAFSQVIISLCEVVIVEFFPTTTRSLALSMMMMSGRTGTLVGNVTFPIFLRMGCVVPFYTMAGLMAEMTHLFRSIWTTGKKWTLLLVYLTTPQGINALKMFGLRTTNLNVYSLGTTIWCPRYNTVVCILILTLPSKGKQ